MAAVDANDAAAGCHRGISGEGAAGYERGGHTATGSKATGQSDGNAFRRLDVGSKSSGTAGSPGLRLKARVTGPKILDRWTRRPAHRHGGASSHTAAFRSAGTIPTVASAEFSLVGFRDRESRDPASSTAPISPQGALAVASSCCAFRAVYSP